MEGSEEVPIEFSIPMTSTIEIKNNMKVLHFEWSPPRSYYKKILWLLKYHVPYSILLISSLEVICYVISNEKYQLRLRFEPNKMKEVWRFITYMLLHEDWLHLWLNIVIQMLFAYFLEIRHNRLRILILYLAGGVTAVLGATCFHPDLVIGASGAVYALLTSHVADIILNYENMNYKIYRCGSILIIVLFDIVYNIIHFTVRTEPVISWGAHVTGAVSGLLLGLVLFKKEEHSVISRKVILFWSGLVLYVVLFVSMMILIFQVKKCTPPSLIKIKYIYFC